MGSGWRKIWLLLLLLPLAVVWLMVTGKQSIDAVDVEIRPGSGSSRIASVLQTAGVIDSKLAFKLLTMVTGKSGSLKGGLYHFEGELSLRDVVKKIERGEVIRFQVTVPEGLRTHDVLELVAEKTKSSLKEWRLALEELLPDQEWEGKLLPETYSYSRPVNPAALLEQMITAQRALIASLTTDQMEAERLRIIASIIEKETGVDAERPLVSAVIRNRIERGMPLQMDPTVIYGIWRRDSSFSGDIRKNDLTADTPWNSYTRRGLPPTPICNPGVASFRAAAAPADVSYLYFVADGTGGHAFASTHEEHQANVKQWMQIERRQNRQRNAGK
ncbi:MAG: endolytic transglycosylase MltG [Mariprofundaceae bacterium]|nr:endolytic transglycosylase MltG [Mariprofundaceae bacterium]